MNLEQADQELLLHLIEVGERGESLEPGSDEHSAVLERWVDAADGVNFLCQKVSESARIMEEVSIAIPNRNMTLRLRTGYKRSFDPETDEPKQELHGVYADWLVASMGPNEFSVFKKERVNLDPGEPISAADVQSLADLEDSISVGFAVAAGLTEDQTLEEE